MITPKRVKIQQIAIAPESESRPAELYGVGTDWIVYFYSKNQKWIPLSDEIGENPLLELHP